MIARPYRLALLLSATLILSIQAQESRIVLDEREQQIRDRYEQVLLRAPMQESAFDRVYQSYLMVEGVEAWVDRLAPEEGPTTPEALALLGRVQARQFKTADAIASLEQARNLGLQDPALDLLLGRLYYENGQDDDAAALLTAALEQSLAPETRAEVARILGNIYLRQGNRDEAIAAWSRLTDDNPGDIFALVELAEIYEDNRMWTEAVTAYTRLAELAAGDPYQQCRAYRAAGRAHLQMEAYPEAIAAFEMALDLVAPGNWLFDDLKLRLVAVYEDLGDLPGLAAYLNEKLMDDPGDAELRELLAETYTRMARFDEAEAQHRQILARDPGRTATYERLIALYERQERPADVAATYEALISRYPTEPEYLRCLGEVYLRQDAPEAALASWRRVLGDPPTAYQHAQLAAWLEQYEFQAEAIVEYEAALALQPDKDWTFRLAALKHAGGEEDAAKALWTSVLSDESSASERAEVASVLENFGYREQAEPILVAALAQEPGNLELHHALARNRMAQENYEEAQPLFEAMAAQSENAYFQERGESGLLDVYARLGILAEQKEAWERAAHDNPDDPGQLMRLARMYARSGDNAGALVLYERCVELQPDSADYLHTLARAYARESRTTDAIERYEELVALDANRAGGYYRELLDIYLKADFRDEAIATAQKIVELAPSDAEAYLELGQIYMLYQQHDAALAAYRSALRLAPDEPDYYREFGEALFGQQRFGEAQEAFRKMLDAAPEDEIRLRAVTSLAQVYQLQGRTDALVEEFQGRVRNTPKRLASYEELAAIYEHAGDVARSVEVLENGYNAVDDKAAALKSLVRASHDARDFSRVVRYFEDLLALAGKASAYEYERLGRVYLEMGEIEQAKRTWRRIVEEEPDDPQSYVILAQALRDAGFEEESMAATEAALERDPHNYTLRFAYARDLARIEDVGNAYAQLQMLLDLGPGAEGGAPAGENAERERRRAILSRDQIDFRRLNQFTPNYRPGNVRYTASAPRGSFESLRPRVISTMAGLAESSVGLDTFIETYEARVSENPGSEEAFNDLIMVYESTGRTEEARTATEALVALRPDDVDLLDRLAVQYAVSNDAEKALAALARIDELEPSRRKENDLARVYLLYGSGEKSEGRALIQRLRQENPDDYAVLNSTLSIASQFNEPDLVLALAEEIDGMDPRQQISLQYALARAYAQTGNAAGAQGVYEKILFAPDDSGANALRLPRGNRIPIYSPQAHGGRLTQPFNRGLSQLLGMGFLHRIDSRRTGALEQLMRELEGEDRAAVLQRVRAEAEQFATADSRAGRERAWQFGMLSVGQLIVEGELEAARAVLAPFQAGVAQDVSVYNLANILNEQQGDYNAMLAVYQQLREAYPGQLLDIIRAELNALLLAERFDEVVDRIQELARRGTPPNDLVSMIQQLHAAGQPALARALLEEQLSGLQRNPQALSMLAAIYSSENDDEKAMELAREAWERQSRRTSRVNTMRFSHGGHYQPAGIAVDEELSTWYRYANNAGRGDELVAEFEARVEQQPGSISAHEHLAALYILSDQRNKAIALYKQLTERRPHYSRAQTALAQLYEQAGQYNEAIALYEAFMRARPGLSSNLSWQVRRLYQRVGRGDELAKIEDDMVKQARTPDQLQQLAYQFRNAGDLERAADLFEKAISMEPDQVWYLIQLAEVYQELGKTEETLAVYEKWYASPATRTRGHADQHLLAQMVGHYRALDRLDELKARNEMEVLDNPNDLIARSVQAHIALAEHRLSDAEADLLDVLKARPSPEVIDLLITIAEYQDNAVAKLDQLASEFQTLQYPNYRRVARIYLAAGNKDQALAYWDKSALQQGSWGLQSVMQELVDFGLYVEAEAYYRKHRKRAPNLNEVAVDMYLQGHGPEGLIDDLLQDGVDDAAQRLVGKLVRDRRTSYTWCLDMLTPLLAREPKNRFLLGLMHNLHVRGDRPAEALPYAERALALQPHDTNLRRDLADTLVALGREDEAFQLYAELLVGKFNGEYALAALDFYLRQNHLQHAEALRAQAAGVLDERNLEEIDRQLARDAGRRGYARDCADQLKTAFEKEPNEPNLSAYLQYLLLVGYGEEAYAVCMAQAESGLIGSRVLGDTNLGVATVQYGNLEDVVHILWNQLRHSERWERENQLRQMVNSYAGVGFGRPLLDALRNRAFEENPPFRPLLLLLADHYLELGDGTTALAIIDGLIGERPGQRVLVAKKADILEQLKRYDEAIALRSNMPGAMTLAEESADQIAFVRTLLAAGRIADAHAVIEKLAAWNQSAQTSGQLGEVLYQAGQFEAALPWLERGMKDLERRKEVSATLVSCYLAVGDTENATRIWEENRSQRVIDALYHSLDEEAHPAMARRVYEARHASDPADREAWSRLTSLLLRAGDTPGALELFRRRLDMVPLGRTDDAINAFGALLASHGVLLPLVEAPPLEEPTLIRAMVAGYRNLPEDQRTDALRVRVLALPLNEVDDILRLAAFFKDTEAADLAVAQYQRALTMPAITEREQLRVLEALDEADALHDAAAPVHSMLAGDTSFLRSPNGLLAFVSRRGDVDLLEAVLDRVRERLPESDALTFYRKLAAYYVGDPTGRDGLTAFAENAVLEEDQWRRLARIFAHAGDKDTEVTLLLRIVEGGFGISARDRALAELVVIHAEAGRLQEAFNCYLAISPEYGDREGLMYILGKHMTAEALPALESAVLAHAGAYPGNVMVPDVVGLVAQLAQRAGLSGDGLAERAAAVLSESQQRVVWQWNDLIEDWLVSPRIDLTSHDDFLDDSPTQAFLNAEGAPTDTTGWTSIDARASLGVISLGDKFYEEEEPMTRSGAFAWTTITREIGGSVALTFAASTERAQIWVNGVPVDSARSRGHVRPGETRFTVDLQSGINHIVVKSQHANRRWYFCLGPAVVEAGMSEKVYQGDIPAPEASPAVTAAP